LGGAKRACGDNTGPLVGVETDELNVPGVQSFLEELGRSPDHQTTEKNCQQRHHDQAVQSAARPTRHDLSEHHFHQQHASAKAGETVV